MQEWADYLDRLKSGEEDADPNAFPSTRTDTSVSSGETERRFP